MGFTEELLLKISGDSSGGQKAAEETATALGHVQKKGEDASLSVYQLRSAIQSFLDGNFTHGVESLAASIGADLEGKISLTTLSMGAMVGVAAAVGFALVEIGEHAVDAGHDLLEFSYKTGSTVEAASALDYAAKIADSSLDQLGNTVFMMQKRMAENPDDFEKGLERIGLSIKDLEGLDPVDQFLKIASAFRENTTESNRAATAFELFSRQGRDITPLMMKPLQELTDKARELGHVMSTEDARAAEELHEKWNTLKADASWMATGAGLGVIHFFQEVSYWMMVAATIPNIGTSSFKAEWDKWIGELPKVRDIMKDLVAKGVTPLKDGTAEYKDVLKDLDEQNKEHAAGLKKSTEEHAKLKAAMDDAHSSLTDLSGAQVEAIRYYLQQHVSIDEIVKILEVYKHQVQQVEQAEKDDLEIKKQVEAFDKISYTRRLELGKQFAAAITDQLKRTNQQTVDNFQDEQKLLEEHALHDTRTLQGEFDARRLQVDQWLAHEKIKLEERGGNWAAAYAAAQQVAEDRLNDIEADEEQFFRETAEKAKQLHPALDSLADGFLRMGQAAGGAMSGIVGGIGQVINAIKALKKSQDEGTDNAGATALTGILGGAAIGAGADTSGGFNHTMISGIVGNSAGSAASAIALGIATMGISVGISAAVAGLKYIFRDRTVSDIAKDAGTKFGEAWSDSLVKTVAANAKKFHDEVTGELVSLPDIIKEHPIDASNVEMYTAKVHDLFSAIETGHLTVAQAGVTLDAVFSQLATAATDADGRISAGLRDVIRLNDQFGTQSKAIAAWQQGQGSDAINAFVSTMGAAALTTKQDMEALTTSAMAAYTAAVASGMSEAEALKLIGPSLQQIRQGYDDIGAAVENDAFLTLELQSLIVSDSPKLVAGIAGITKEMIALDNIGLENIKTFEAEEHRGTAMYVQLQAETAKFGGTTRDALIPMQTYLHQAEIEAKNLGVPLDANTQMLVDQSKELGIWKETGKSAADKLTDAMGALVDKVSALIDQLAGVKRGINDLPTSKDITITTHYNQDGQNTGDGLPSAAFEGFFARPTTVRVGDDPAGEGEYVLHKATVDRLVRQARTFSAGARSSLSASAVSAAAASAGAGAPTIEVNLTVEGHVHSDQDLIEFIKRGLYDDRARLGGLIPAVR